MNPGDPKTLDPYRYADNNPVVFTDASGLRPACASGGALDQDACYYGAKGVELNPYLPDEFEGAGNREYDRGMNGPKRQHNVVTSSGDWLFLPKLAVNFLGGVLNVGVSTANGAIWLGSTVTSGPPPRIPSVPVWDGDSPERGRFYYWASYTGSVGAVLASLRPSALRTGISEPASDATVVASDAGVLGDHLVLGKSIGLEDNAADIGGRHLMFDKAWQESVLGAINNPSTRISVALDGVEGSSTYAKVANAALRGERLTVVDGEARSPVPFDWEMAQLMQSGRLPTVELYEGGQQIANPFQ